MISRPTLPTPSPSAPLLLADQRPVSLFGVIHNSGGVQQWLVTSDDAPAILLFLDHPTAEKAAAELVNEYPGTTTCVVRMKAEWFA